MHLKMKCALLEIRIIIGLDTVLKKVQRNLLDREMECERFKKELNAAQQQKAEFEEKARKLGNKVEMFEKKGN